MGDVLRKKPIEAAEEFVASYFAGCQAAILAGSVVRGEETRTSDLDIVIIDQSVPSSYRESILENGWPIEVFVHNLTSYQQYVKSDCERAKPCLPKMVSEGIVLKDEGFVSSMKKEAEKILAQGPKRWGKETIDVKRYFITDALDDFIGADDRGEAIFSANTLAGLLHEFVLRTNGKWIGSSKWIVRSLKQFDAHFAKTFVDAFDAFYQYNEKNRVLILTENVLRPHGGRLFEGFSSGKINQ
ncbi:nucleotidyltransferase domain-containing protein [Actinomycetes bacterium NPDC127524]